jgi:riboflavin synthase alpha subunit
VAGPSRLGIDHAAVARRLKIGGSIAVNGCCLTVVKKTGPVFLQTSFLRRCDEPI